MHAFARAAGRFTLVLLPALALGLLAFAEEAAAHGGRIRPPPPTPGDVGPGWKDPTGRIPVRPVPLPPPTTPGPITPGPKPKPLTPGGNGVPQPGGPTTPPSSPKPAPLPPGTNPGQPDPTNGTGNNTPAGRTRPRVAVVAPESRWQMWWELNRWQFFPERNVRWAKPDAAITPSGDGGLGPVDLRKMAAARRALITRQQIIPFLLHHLDPDVTTRVEVRAAAAIALAKVCHDQAAIDLIFHHAENTKAPLVVRESAALAIGLLRRDEAENRLDGVRTDALRARLFVLIDDSDTPVRTRALAAFSIGLLGDQHFGSPFTKYGRVTARALWRRAQRKHAGRELSVALMTAMGMQPAAGTSQEMKDALRRIASGRRVARRSWDDFERSHALTAVVRQQGPGWQAILLRTITNKRVSASVRRAAFVALGAQCEALTPAERLDAARATLQALRLSRDPLTRGLGTITLGRLQGADLRKGEVGVLERCEAARHLLNESHHGSHAHRGFAAIALGLALRGAKLEPASARRFHKSGLANLAQGWTRMKNPDLRGAYAVALGLVGEQAAGQIDALRAVLDDRKADPDVRGHAAVALSQMGPGSVDTRKSLRRAILEKRSVSLRSNAALALSFLGGDAETKRLVEELAKARSQWVLAQGAAALGQLGDLSAVPGILAVAGDLQREDESRALAIAALGMLGDPERKPSMLRLSADSNYAARTEALQEALTIF